MLLLYFFFVDRFCITSLLSTVLAFLQKLFMFTRQFAFWLQTVFVPAQVVDIKVENRLVHRNMACLSTTVIDI